MSKIKIGDIISFKYLGGRFVKGEVISCGEKDLSLTLHTDYIGKNVEWFAGETKHFHLNICKKIKIYPKKETNP